MARRRKRGRAGAPSALRPGNWPVRWRLAAVSAGLTLVILLVFGAVIGQVATSGSATTSTARCSSAVQILAGEIRIVYTPLGHRSYRRARARRLRPPRRRLGPASSTSTAT